MDVENFKRLFLPLHPKLFRIAYALVENKADAEDILQDAYYKLWSRRNELTDIQNPEAFCVTLVKNLCLDFLRSPRANRRDADVTEAVTLSTLGIMSNIFLEMKTDVTLSISAYFSNSLSWAKHKLVQQRNRIRNIFFNFIRLIV